MAAPLTNEEAAFVEGVSRKTGIDPRVIVAWVQQEGAYAPHGTGGFNFLNLRPYRGDPYSGVSAGGFEQFSSVGDAITATVRRIKQPFAAPIEQAAAAHVTPRQEIAAIASTGWDAGHYGGPGGPNLAQTFASIFTPAGLDSSYQGPGTAAGVAATAGTGSAADITSTTGGLEKLPHAITGWVSDLTDFLKEYAIRVAEVVGGMILVVASLFLLTRGSVPLPGGV